MAFGMNGRDANKLGSIAIVAAFGLSAVLAVWASLLGAMTPLVMALLGVVAAFFGISGKERPTFLLASVALAVVPSAILLALPFVGGFVSGFLTNLAAFGAAAAILTAPMTYWETRK